MKLQDVRNMDKNDFLGLLGLETKHSFPIGYSEPWALSASACWLVPALPCSWHPRPEASCAVIYARNCTAAPMRTRRRRLPTKHDGSLAESAATAY